MMDIYNRKYRPWVIGFAIAVNVVNVVVCVLAVVWG